jgi:hypothetical protein
VALALSPGVLFEAHSGRLYASDADHAIMLFPWPEMLAFRRPRGSQAWKAYEPDCRLLVRDAADEAPAEECRQVEGHHGNPGPQDARDIQRAIDCYCAAIPADVRRVVATFPQRQWPLLAWATRTGPAGLDLCQSNPALAFMLAVAWEFRRPHGKMREHAPVLLVYRPQQRVLDWLGFPGTAAVRRVVRKVAHAALDVDRLRDLRAGVANPAVVERLSHIKRINAGVLRMVADGSVLRVPLAELKAAADGPDDATLRRPPPISQFLQAYQADERQAARAIGPLNRARVVRVPTDDHRTRCIVRALPAPPFPGTDVIAPLTSIDMLEDEARRQHNCVVSYTRRIRNGTYAVYRVIYPERCTLGIVRRKNRWHVDQVKGPCNREVGTPTHLALREWLRASAAGVSEPLRGA